MHDVAYSYLPKPNVTQRTDDRIWEPHEAQPHTIERPSRRMGSAATEHDTNTGRGTYQGTGHIAVGNGPQVNGAWLCTVDKITTVRNYITNNISFMASSREPPQPASEDPELSVAGGQDGKRHFLRSPGSSNSWPATRILLAIGLVCLVIFLICLAAVFIWSCCAAFQVIKAVVLGMSWKGQLTLEWPFCSLIIGDRNP
ncbi:hypothetical protein BKA56DRAFT_659547 [Ilyonectria sp. MPI-CAGE-AT-0026]|nr:hypothetical protein BKA56DRAFT_659547 [Ilyonectria sp. MPI-CAGE-AT-0026]